MIGNWFKLYLANFGKNKFFSLLNIFGLSVGITAMLLAILYWKYEKSYDQWNPYKNRIYEVYRDYNGTPMPWVSAPFAKQLDKLNDIIEEYNFSYNNDWKQASVEIDNKKEFLYDIKATQASFFRFFPYKAIYGKAEDYEENWEDAIALELGQSERLFGKEVNPIGKGITLSSGKTYYVRFVYQIQGNSSFAPKGIASLEAEQMIAENVDSNWSDANYTLLIKFKSGVVLKDVQSKIIREMYDPLIIRAAKEEGVSKEQYVKENISSSELLFFVLDGAHLNPDSTVLGAGPTASKVLYMLVGAAVLLLILSILNTVNLSLVNGFNRAKEVGIRKTLGSTRSQLVCQYIFESAITVGISMILAMVLVELVLPYFNVLVNRSIYFDLLLTLPLLLLILLILILASGILPALFISSFDTLKVLKGNFMRSRSGVVIRNTLLVIQFFIAFFFLTVTIVVNQQVNYMLDQDLGFKGEQVINIDFAIDNVENRDVLFKKVVNDFKKVKGVIAVSEHSLLFGPGFNSSSSNHIGDVSIRSENLIIDTGFKDVFDIEIKEGRFFDSRINSEGTGSVLVNESYARTFNFKESIVGKEVNWNNRYFKIIGVVKDMKNLGFSTEVLPCTYFTTDGASWLHNLLRTVSVKIDPTDVQGTLERIEQFWKKRVDSTYPIKYNFANKDFENSYRETLNQRTLLTILTIVSVFIALFGLIAVVAFSIQNRLKEIAIRKVLGADTGVLIYGLTRTYFVYCMLGFAISVYPVVYLMKVWLAGFAYHIELSWLAFLLAGSLLTLFSLVLVVFKAWKATRIDVLKYIKYE
ncbi:ABC transporter permease [Myroides marinus]|uniref:ABC transporter permease n=1 Tax=Myroides marinus TaxID=703342 RepID=UPI002575C4A0|nr:ABC transporter permease [Myroides marinus]MDM1352789.1 ABC transporter permease [Myroides marinus]MDM1359983.1 ABC transporter permease [Myroides marinus]